MKFEGEIQPSTHFVSTPVFFFVYNVENYYHFIYDTLPYLWWYFELKKVIPELTLLTQYPSAQHAKMYPFVEQSLQLLGINEYLLLDPTACYEHLYISSSLTHEDQSNEPPNKQAFEVWNKLIHNALQVQPTINPGKKLYISRRTHLNSDNSNIGTNYTQRRKMINEDELVQLLATNYNYTEVFPEQWDMATKVHAFYNATHIVGAIGGGMCNLLFSPPSTKSVVIVSPDFMVINNRFKYSMDHTDIKYYFNTELASSKYIRVKVLTGEHKGKYGEIQSETCEEVEIALGDETSVSIQSEIGITITLPLSHVEKLDEGLNSPFMIHSLKDLVNDSK